MTHEARHERDVYQSRSKGKKGYFQNLFRQIQESIIEGNCGFVATFGIKNIQIYISMCVF